MERRWPRIHDKIHGIEGSRDILVTNIMFLSNEASRLQEIIFQGISPGLRRRQWTMAAIIGNSSLIRNVISRPFSKIDSWIRCVHLATKLGNWNISHLVRWFTDFWRFWTSMRYYVNSMDLVLSHFSIILNIYIYIIPKELFYLTDEWTMWFV